MVNGGGGQKGKVGKGERRRRGGVRPVEVPSRGNTGV